MFDGKAFGQEIVGVVKAHLEKSLAPILARLDAIDKRFAELPVPKEFDPVTFGEWLAPTADELRGLIEAIKIEPAPELPDIPAMVAEAVAVLPKPENGKDGAPGANGLDGAPGLNGKDGRDGLDAVEFLRGADGHLIVTMSNGTTRDLGAVNGTDGAAGTDGKDGAPGKDGVDGVSFDDLDLVETEEGVFLRCARGDVVKQWRLPIVIDRGVFKDGQPYRKGDGVTWGGSFWIAQGETTDKPDSGKGGWRLAVKKGRDGKDGTVKEPKPAAPVKVG